MIDVDSLVTATINRCREQADAFKEGILGGALSPEEYKYQTGFLNGMEAAVNILIETARKGEEQDASE